MNIERIVQLKPEEEVLAVVREDFWPHAPKLLFAVLWLLLPFFFLFPLLRLGVSGVLIFFGLFIAALVFFLRNTVKRKHTALIITDRRIIDVDQKGLFDRTVTGVAHAQIDEASYRIKGLMSTMLRLGVLRLKTSGETADIEFKRVRQPEKIQNLINELRDIFLDEDKSESEEKLKRLAKKVSPEDLEKMARKVRRREQKEALEVFFDE